MDSVSLKAADGRSVVLSGSSSGTDAPYEPSGRLVVNLSAPGLHIRQGVLMFGLDWKGLVAYFDDLAESWRGWSGSKEWSALEHELTIRAQSGALGHCHFEFIVQDAANPSWKASLKNFEIAAGEDLSNFATAVRDWVGGSVFAGTEDALVCVRCDRPVRVNSEYYLTFERMHWTCFHFEFEHEIGGPLDPDRACRDPSCPTRSFDPDPPSA